MGSSPQFAWHPHSLRPHNLAFKKRSNCWVDKSLIYFLADYVGSSQTFCSVIAHLIFTGKFHLELSASTVMVKRLFTNLHRKKFQKYFIFINRSTAKQYDFNLWTHSGTCAWEEFPVNELTETDTFNFQEHGVRTCSLLKDTPCLVQHEHFPPDPQQLLQNPGKRS